MVMMRINDDLMSFKPYALDEMIGEGSIIGELCHFIDLACYITKRNQSKFMLKDGHGLTKFNSSI